MASAKRKVRLTAEIRATGEHCGLHCPWLRGTIIGRPACALFRTEQNAPGYLYMERRRCQQCLDAEVKGGDDG